MKNNSYLIKILFVICAVFILSVFTYYSPKLDQVLAIMPYDSIHAIFYGESHIWCKIIYFSIPVITILITVVMFGIIVAKNKNIRQTTTKRVALVVLLSMLLGPGLIINTVLKNNWGRPRPYQVIRDGKVFHPVWYPDFKSPHDNSFPSGHASIGFLLGVPLLAIGFRRRGILVSLIGGAIIGSVRILQGGHYLSDVVYCGLIVWLIAEACNFLLKSKIYVLNLKD